jgi:hypothetical protein
MTRDPSNGGHFCFMVNLTATRGNDVLNGMFSNVIPNVTGNLEHGARIC